MTSSGYSSSELRLWRSPLSVVRNDGAGTVLVATCLLDAWLHAFSSGRTCSMGEGYAVGGAAGVVERSAPSRSVDAPWSRAARWSQVCAMCRRGALRG